MNILVTGGAGFIGSNLVDYLLDKKHKIIIVDNFSTGKKINIQHIKNDIVVYDESIENIDLNECGEINAIVHLAAQPSVPLSIENFKMSSESNINGTINVLDYCSQKKIPFVYASSSAIYGNLSLGDDKCYEIDLLSPYAADKYAMEIYAETAFKVYNLSSIGLRFFNVYGPRQDPSSPYSGVISIFADRLLKRESITINGGHQTRDFIYVKDVVKCIYEALNISRDNVICDSVNVLTGKSLTINQLSEIMERETGYHPEKTYKELPLGDPEVSQGTSEKLMELLHVTQSEFTKIEDGLSKTIKYIREYE